jgi:hypothetical protein
MFQPPIDDSNPGTYQRLHFSDPLPLYKELKNCEENKASN